MAVRKRRPARDRALEHVNSQRRHRRPKPQDPMHNLVLTTGAVLMLGVLVWAAGTVLAHLFGWLS